MPNAFASTFAIRTGLDTKLKLQKSLQANAHDSLLDGHSTTGQEARTANKSIAKRWA